MQYKTTSKDACSDSLLPSTSEEPSNGETTTVTFCQEGRTPGNSPPEKSPLTDVPLNSEQLGALYNKDVPYNPDPAHQAVWSTETSKVHPGRPRIAGRNTRRVTVVCQTLILLLAGVAGLYLCFNGFTSLLKNYESARELLLVGDEARLAVHIVADLDNIPKEFEGKLVWVSGPLIVADPLSYDECGVTVTSVKLRRTFDTNHIYVRSSAAEQYFMSEKWPQARLGKEHLCQAPGLLYNSMMDTDESQIAADVRIGPLTLGHRLKEKFEEYYVVSEKLMVMDDTTAFRVMYSDSGRNNTTYSIMGQLSNGSIKPYELLDYYTIILKRENAVGAEAMIDDRVNTRLQKLDAENWWSYMEVGLGMLVPLTVILHYAAIIRAMKKNKRNHVMLSMPVQ